MNKIIFFTYVLFFTLTVLAKQNNNVRTEKTLPEYAVNMQDGGFILKEEGFHLLKVDRTYRSRSVDHGFFGQGWCSDFESELIFQGQGVIRLVNCQSSRPSLFKISPTAVAYINMDNPSDRILIKLGHYERQIQNQWSAKYNFKGKIIEVRKNNEVFKIVYNQRQLPAQISSIKNSIQFEWHPILDLIEKVISNGKTEILTYSGFNLVKVKSGLQTISYEYDDLDNLVSRTYGSKKAQLLVEYNKDEDRVLKIKGTCVEHYSYLKKNPKRSLATVSKVCKNLVSITEFIFDYKNDRRSPAEITVNMLPVLDRLSLNQGNE